MQLRHLSQALLLTTYLRASYKESGSIPASSKLSCVQVNVTNREAALSPPSSDSLVAFAGDYVTYVLPEKEGYPATQTRSLSIEVEKTGEHLFGL